MVTIFFVDVTLTAGVDTFTAGVLTEITFVDDDRVLTVVTLLTLGNDVRLTLTTFVTEAAVGELAVLIDGEDTVIFAGAAVEDLTADDGVLTVTATGFGD